MGRRTQTFANSQSNPEGLILAQTWDDPRADNADYRRHLDDVYTPALTDDELLEIRRNPTPERAEQLAAKLHREAAKMRAIRRVYIQQHGHQPAGR